MNESSITIRWEKNPEGGTEIKVEGNKEYTPYFREAFLTVETPYAVNYVTERETSGENAQKSATIALLSNLIKIIQNSNKTNGTLINEKEHSLKFPLTDLITIRKFAEITGIEIDETKFRNRREFQMYFRSLMKEEKGKEDWR